MSKLFIKSLVIILFLIISNISNAEIIDERYCDILKLEIKNDIGNFYAYRNQMSDFTFQQDNLNGDNEDDLEEHKRLQRLIDRARALFEASKERIHKNSITWNNLCK